MATTNSKVKATYPRTKTVRVVVEKRFWPIKGHPDNVGVYDPEYPESSYTSGTSVDEALENFKEWYEMKHDEWPHLIVIKTSIV